MSLREKYLKILSGIIPVGAVGASLLLGSTTPSTANEQPVGLQTSVSNEVRVSERLAAIREAVSAVAQPESGAKSSDGNFQLAWGNRWNNWGWARGAAVGVGVGHGTTGATARTDGTIGGVTGEGRLRQDGERRRAEDRAAGRAAHPCNIDCRHCYLPDRNSKAVVAQNGTLASTETAYCRLTKLRVTDLVLDALERV
jgi:hypothetical protein